MRQERKQVRHGLRASIESRVVKMDHELIGTKATAVVAAGCVLCMIIKNGHGPRDGYELVRLARASAPWPMLIQQAQSGDAPPAIIWQFTFCGRPHRIGLRLPPWSDHLEPVGDGPQCGWIGVPLILLDGAATAADAVVVLEALADAL